MVSAILPSACFCYLPIAALHRPIEDRRFQMGALRRGDPMTLGTFLVALVMASKTDELSSPVERAQRLGRQLSAIGYLLPAEFEDYALLALRQQWAAELSALDDMLSSRPHMDNPLWREDIRAAIRARKELLEEPELPALSDCPDLDISSQEGRAKLQQLIVAFGELVATWDLVLEAATQLGQDGHKTIPEASNATSPHL
jgi:hypothetical protein